MAEENLLIDFEGRVPVAPPPPVVQPQRVELQQRPFAQPLITPVPPRVTLTAFWAKDPLAWFRLAEATFNRHGIQDAGLRFDLVLPALPEDGLERIRHVLRESYLFENPYEELKAELVRQYTPNVLEQLMGIIHAPELGGQTPSQLMHRMMSLLPPGEPPGLLFKMHFLVRLPTDIRDQVAKKLEELDARDLAVYADSRYHARNAKKSPGQPVAAVGSSAEEEIAELTGTLAAMPASGAAKKQQGTGNKARGRGQSGSGGRGGGGGGTAGRQTAVKSPYVCLRHCKFAERAYRCDDPDNCTWAGNGSAGGL